MQSSSNAVAFSAISSILAKEHSLLKEHIALSHSGCTQEPLLQHYEYSQCEKPASPISQFPSNMQVGYTAGMLRSVTQRRQAPPGRQHMTSGMPPMTTGEARDVLINVHHTLHDIQSSMHTLHSRIDEMWNEICILKGRQEIVEHVVETEIGVEIAEAEVPGM